METKTIKFSEIIIEITSSEMADVITSNMKEKCPGCGDPNCYYDACNESDEFEDDARTRHLFNTAIDALESMILAHFGAGINVGSEEYVAGITTAYDALCNNIYG